MEICQYCLKSGLKNINAKRQHECRCSKNPNRKLNTPHHKGGKNGFKPWNTGLTKTDPRVAAYSVKSSITLTGRKGHPISDKHRNRMRQVAIERGLGGVRPSRQITYNGVKLGSSYEVILAQDLDANGVTWEKPKKFPYTDPYGKNRSYTPDFFLPNFNVYLDPKNDFLLNNPNPALGFHDLDKIRLVENQNNIKIIVLSKSQLSWTYIKTQLPI